MAGDNEHHAARIEFHRKRLKDMADAFDNARSSDAQEAAKDKSFQIGAEIITNVERMAHSALIAAAQTEKLTKLTEAILEEMRKMNKPVEITMIEAGDIAPGTPPLDAYLRSRADPMCRVCNGTGAVRNPSGVLSDMKPCPACIEKGTG